jgi:hypothetical protein
VTTCSASPCRISPWSTKTQVSWWPIASWISTAADRAVDSAREAADHPARAHLLADLGDLGGANSAIVQSPARPQTRWTKLAISLPPSGVWTTSGWNWTP